MTQTPMKSRRDHLKLALLGGVSPPVLVLAHADATRDAPPIDAPNGEERLASPGGLDDRA